MEAETLLSAEETGWVIDEATLHHARSHPSHPFTVGVVRRDDGVLGLRCVMCGWNPFRSAA